MDTSAKVIFAHLWPNFKLMLKFHLIKHSAGKLWVNPCCKPSTPCWWQWCAMLKLLRNGLRKARAHCVGPPNCSTPIDSKGSVCNALVPDSTGWLEVLSTCLDDLDQFDPGFGCYGSGVFGDISWMPDQIDFSPSVAGVLSYLWEPTGAMRILQLC